MRQFVTGVSLLVAITAGGDVVSLGGEVRTKSEVRLTTVPPSPFTDQITLDVRVAVRNGTDAVQTYEVVVHLDEEDGEHVLHRETDEVPARSAKGVYFRWPTRERAGQHRLIVVARGADATCRAVETIDVVKSDVPSLGRITGAWAGIVHFDDGEGERWNTDIRAMTDAQWRALIHDVHAIGMDTVVITQAFLNGNLRYGQHSMEKDGFSGRALYPSKLFPERELIASEDPIETVLASADALDMHVFLGVGIYAFFDFTPASLKWHIQVTDELYERYGHHRSLYGWYVADECPGALLSTDDENAQIAEFFRGYRAHVRTITPEMPVMMAPNSFYMLKAEKGWAAILRHLDILCPFGWNRMRKDDAQGDAVARRLQQLCDEAGAHFWMDLEVFLACRRPKPDPRYIGNPLWPRPIEEIVDELRQYPRFEKVLCFQYPGIMTAPEATPRLGGDEAVKLYEDYRRLLESATTNPSR